MSYYFFLGETLLPVAPAAIDTTINGKNTTINLIDEGEATIIKAPGLTDIAFKFMLPNREYPFANYDTSLRRGLIDYAVGEVAKRFGARRLFGNSFSYKPAATFLDAIKDAKENVNPMRFIVTRMNFDGAMLWNTNMLTTIEDYTISENANNATDIEVAIKLREYVPFGTQEVEVVKDKDGKETLKVKERRYTPDEKYPAAVKITNQLSVLETVKGVGNGTLDWRAAAKRSGLENPLAKNLKGKVVKLG